jgi:hypothetical protein
MESVRRASKQLLLRVASNLLGGPTALFFVSSVQRKFLFIELYWHSVIAVTDGNRLHHIVYKDFTRQMRVVRELREPQVTRFNLGAHPEKKVVGFYYS